MYHIVQNVGSGKPNFFYISKGVVKPEPADKHCEDGIKGIPKCKIP